MDENQVEGRNAVLELIESGKDINKIFVQAGETYKNKYDDCANEAIDKISKMIEKITNTTIKK